MTAQPEGVPWPTASWPVGEAPAAAATVVAELMAQPPELGLTLAVAVVHRGRLVAEAYGPDTTADTTLISWSTAKSVTHAVVGLLVGDGRLELHEPAPVAAWEGDERSRITLQHLLEVFPVEGHAEGDAAELTDELMAAVARLMRRG